ncbi:aspartyl-phosphate phosphatase Spo0E family protein [Desmospora activa]|uniref:aspartyl-phosphate phosphatase Spo0E family protein n=1 Tax=Desmospora activa TaxID=500615 RepID=UPI000D30526B|nr:aspartyl-phosphate phosphatase Spo0E family protein [Desmospora activa]
MNATDLKSLEQELEKMRQVLHQQVGGNVSALSHAAVLPISRRLDYLLNRYYELKQKQSF